MKMSEAVFRIQLCRIFPFSIVLFLSQILSKVPQTISLLKKKLGIKDCLETKEPNDRENKTERLAVF